MELEGAEGLPFPGLITTEGSCQHDSIQDNVDEIHLSFFSVGS